MTPEELKALIEKFHNGSRLHHHKIVRELAQELLQVKFENVLLKAMVPEPVHEVHILEDCEKVS